MPLDPFAAAAEVLITSLFDGPGTLPTLMTAASYTSVAAQFHAAAASVDGSMVLMNEAWRSSSADKAQGAFRVYSSWLHKQGDVAAETAAALTHAAGAYTTAQQEMGAVQAWLTEFEVRQALLAMGGPSTTPVMLMTESESLAILGAAVGVMATYEGNLSGALASFPEPVTAQPIVGNSGGSGLPNGYPAGSLTTPGLSNSALSVAQSPNSSGLSSNSTNPVQQSSGSPEQSANPVSQPSSASSPTDPEQAVPDAPAQTSATDSGANDDTGSTDPASGQSIGANSGYSPTFAGLGMGTSSMVAIGMTRGGLGSMAGASTGYRMPVNWSSRGVRAFGAAEAEAEAEEQSVARTTPRGATAPEAQMRRRAKNRTRSGTVIAPGVELEVPLLEEPAAIGVLEYDDRDDSADDLGDEPSPTLGIIERVDDFSQHYAAQHNVTGDIRRD